MSDQLKDNSKIVSGRCRGQSDRPIEHPTVDSAGLTDEQIITGWCRFLESVIQKEE